MKPKNIVLCVVSFITIYALGAYMVYQHLKPMYREGELTNCYVKIEYIEFKTVTFESGKENSFYRAVLTCTNNLDREIKISSLFQLSAYCEGKILGNIGGYGLNDATDFHIMAPHETFTYIQYFILDNTFNKNVEFIVRDASSSKRINLNIFAEVGYNEQGLGTSVTVRELEE